MPSIVTAALIEALLELFLYGVYAVLFTTVVYLFRGRRGSSPEKRPVRWVLLGLIAQFLIITAHWVNTIYQTLFAIVHLGGGAPAAAFYSDLATPSSIVHITLRVICALLTDLLVIHRLYAIFSYRRNVILFPLTLLVGQAVCGSSIIYRFANSGGFFIQYSLSNPWLTTDLVLSILIVTIGVLVTFQVGFIGEIVLSGVASAIFGISTVLIHARIGLGWAHDADRQIGSNPTRINFARNDILEDEHELEDHRHK
ncbi:hypothetical protein FB451DRAFT_1399278 [Mycena latifolia]|nr:hypothetical protein FB451DRAFT_1399278 [Mycena latifolia]